MKFKGAIGHGGALSAEIHLFGNMIGESGKLLETYFLNSIIYSNLTDLLLNIY